MTAVLAPLLAAGVLATMTIGRLPYFHGRTRQDIRKTSHVMVSCFGAFLPLLFADRQPLLLMCAILAVMIPLGAAANWYPSVATWDSSAQGPVVTVVLYALLMLFVKNDYQVMAACLIVGLADASACMVGMRYGRTQIGRDNPRTWVGTFSFALVSFGIILASAPFLGLQGTGAFMAAFCVASTVAALEATVPSGVDNLVIAVASAAILALSASAQPSTLLFVGTVIAVCVLAVWRGWLTHEGALAFFAAGMWLALGLGWGALAVGATFFVSSSLLTKLAPKRAIQEDAKQGRGAAQVWALATVPSIAAAGAGLYGGSLWTLAFVAAMAAAAADAWATEVGRFSRSPPLLITTLRRATAGTSGAVSMLGTLGSGLGAALVTWVAYACGLLESTHALIAGAAAFSASLFDSLCGATLQRRYVCSQCSAAQDHPGDCHGAPRIQRGLSAIGNHTVNFLMSAYAAIVAALWAGAVH